MTICLPSPHNQAKELLLNPLDAWLTLANAFSNHLPLKLGVEDATFCANLQWILQPHIQEKAHLQLCYEHNILTPHTSSQPNPN
jgi:hypothetical protein